MNQIILNLEPGPDGQPVGQLTTGTGQVIRFTGWLHLIRLLEDQLGQAPPRPGADPVADPRLHPETLLPSSRRPVKKAARRMRAKKISRWLVAVFCLAAPLSCTAQSPAADAVSEFAAIKSDPYVGVYDYLPPTGGLRTEVIVQDGPYFKVADLGGKNNDTENFDLGGQLTTCTNHTGAWTCRNVRNELSLPPGATLSPARTLAVMTRIFGDRHLSRGSRVVNGFRLQCLTGANKDQQRTICLTALGAIGYSRTVISGQAFTLILAKVTMSVPPGQFLLPATPAGVS